MISMVFVIEKAQWSLRRARSSCGARRVTSRSRVSHCRRRHRRETSAKAARKPGSALATTTTALQEVVAS